MCHQVRAACGCIILTVDGGELQALVYNILPSTAAVFSYTTGSRKLSANEQFFVGYKQLK